MTRKKGTAKKICVVFLIVMITMLYGVMPSYAEESTTDLSPNKVTSETENTEKLESESADSSDAADEEKQSEDTEEVSDSSEKADDTAADDAVEESAEGTDSAAIEEAAEKSTKDSDSASTDKAAGNSTEETKDSAAEESQQTQDAAAEKTSKMSLKSAETETPSEAGDFLVIGNENAYSYENGVLTITGDVTVTMKDGVESTSDRIVVAENATVTLDGVNIAASGGAAVRIDQGVKATIKLSGTNTVTGASGYAGVEVGYEDGNMATLTIEGDGTINATGGSGSAGIGGSETNKLADGSLTSSYSGNIIINSGTVNATGTNGGSGIGHATNNGRNTNGTSQSRSYKMQANEIGSITINGGTINAVGNTGAGIGGGNHVDSGKITINGGSIKASSNDGAGIGCGRGSSNYGGDANKGHGYFYADVTINGGTIEEAQGGWLSAGIGGGYECDAIITINGGEIKKAIGGNGNSGSYYQGAPGIGAGYQGNVKFEMTGGTISYAKGGWSAPGIGYGACIQGYGSKRKAEGETVSAEDSIIKISGGTIELAEGGMNAAGIGSGNGCSVCNIEITGGNITAKGYSDPKDLNIGGAGIGSGVGTASKLKYSADTDVSISITGGTVVAIGGWGASGIGSGANNKTAETITIDATNANIEAYADGTKFAIDTRKLEDDGTTTSITDGRTITGNILQGTFVHAYTVEDTEQDTEGLDSIILTNDNDNSDTKELKDMPEGYRSFAVNVSDAGTYTVYTDSENIGNGEGRYFSKMTTDQYKEEEATSDNKVKYTVKSGELSDNFYLFPVKTIVVTKKIAGTDSATSGINTTLYFALKDKETGDFLKNSDESLRTEQIEVVNGVPQNKAFFSNIDDKTYDVLEITSPENTESPKGTEYDGDVTLSDITTQHGSAIDIDSDTVTNGKLTITRVEESGKWKITAKYDGSSDESVTLSLYANGELMADPKTKLNSSNNWTAEWTVDKTADGSDITYSVADTSNNATIDKDTWTDYVTVINTYTVKQEETTTDDSDTTKQQDDDSDSSNPQNENPSDDNTTSDTTDSSTTKDSTTVSKKSKKDDVSSTTPTTTKNPLSSSSTNNTNSTSGNQGTRSSRVTSSLPRSNSSSGLSVRTVSDNSTASTARTGDETSVMNWVILMALCGSALALVVMQRRRQQKEAE